MRLQIGMNVLDDSRCLNDRRNINTANNMATQELVAADVMSIVRRYINAFNEGDVKGRAAAFAVPGSILDGMRAHAWQGTTAAQDWYRDVLINTKKEGASDFFRHGWDTATHGDYRGCCMSCGSRDYEVQSPR